MKKFTYIYIIGLVLGWQTSKAGELEACQNRLMQLEETNAALLANADEQINQQILELQTAQETIRSLHKQLESQTKEIAVFTAQIKPLTEELEISKAANELLRSQIKQQAVVSDKSTQYDIEDPVDSGEIKRLEQEILTLEQKLQQTNADSSSEITRLNTTIMSLEEQLQRVTTERNLLLIDQADASDAAIVAIARSFDTEPKQQATLQAAIDTTQQPSTPSPSSDRSIAYELAGADVVAEPEQPSTPLSSSPRGSTLDRSSRPSTPKKDLPPEKMLDEYKRLLAQAHTEIDRLKSRLIHTNHPLRAEIPKPYEDVD